MKKKTCTSCKKEKEFSKFSKNSKSKDGKLARCKDCISEYHAIYYENNKEKIKKYAQANKKHKKEYLEKYNKDNKEKIKKNKKRYYQENKEYQKQWAKEYRKKYPEEVKEVNKKWRGDNKDKTRENGRKYIEKNREKLREYQKNYRIKNSDKVHKKEKERYERKIKRDPLFKLSCNIKSLIWWALKNKNYAKKAKTAVILGCTWQEFKEHLENNTYDFKIDQKSLDLDHIIPLNSAKTEEDVYKLNHYTNFQLLPSDYNRYIKRDKEWDKNHFEEWLKTNNI